MSDVTEALFSYRVKSGMEQRFQAYLDKALPITQNEPYVLGYDIYIGDDGTYFQHERYENEEAIWKHMEATAAGQEDFAASTEMLSTFMVGEFSQKFRDTYGIGVTYRPFRRVDR